jgi:hypothetical protein
MSVDNALSAIPAGLRKPLLDEYKSIIQNFAEHRWAPSELSGGKFCEIIFTILDGHAKGTYASAPTKPSRFVDACKLLEKNGHVPRSFQILIPRLLPALYEVRNNRGVGHAGGDVDPNHMDAVFVMSNCSWVMAELVRVFHKTTTSEAQSIVDRLAERKMPLLWYGEEMRRVLDPKMPLLAQILLLLSTATDKVAVADLIKWTDTKNSNYFRLLLRKMHGLRLIEYSGQDDSALILPPGDKVISDTLAKREAVPKPRKAAKKRR